MNQTGVPMFETCFCLVCVPSKKLIQLAADPAPFQRADTALENYLLMSFLMAIGEMQGIA